MRFLNQLSSHLGSSQLVIPR